jgi:hypothetical protein
MSSRFIKASLKAGKVHLCRLGLDMSSLIMMYLCVSHVWMPVNPVSGIYLLARSLFIFSWLPYDCLSNKASNSLFETLFQGYSQGISY